ncbi:amino acid ABC transporter permease [Gellertiella hungarica]|uniref:Polar amino acid transport system permease protein n=1 Tax=Gellertiella hungarica TaxID=1572859 RepID=A0A7W6NIY8_9HYPH|nr:amino acid ABC transporter permease [Gellertiella hungarica]MBB4062904.1 polar amino acid transport system permease protein [Gellertiella hungarica]
MSFLTRVRPSNLIILSATPFIIYLFATSADYMRSLRALAGVENGSGIMVPGFLILVALAVSGLLALAFMGRRDARRLIAILSVAVHAACLVVLWSGGLAHPFIASALANGVDAFASNLIVPGVSPRQLTPEADLWLRGLVHIAVPVHAALSFAGLALYGAALLKISPALRKAGLLVAGLPNGLLLAFLAFFAHIAFAAGVATTLRAAVLAYLLAAFLGLVWVGMLQLAHSRRTTAIFSVIALLLAGIAAWNLLQPPADYVLAGTREAKIGIVRGTPSSLVGAVRFGQYPGAPEGEAGVRTFLTAEEAIRAVDAKQGVSAVLLPAARPPAGWPVLWQTAALNDGNRSAGITFAVLAIILGILTFGGAIHRRHPLAIGSEFVIDTIRGIPMLVIVLYVGLPLSGAIKDASGGAIDPPNMMRGIVAMAIAYSAYLAEIFRAGINAIPAGQTEAAKSLGLNRWQTARHVVLPQAFRVIIPPLGNELIAILKDTSLLSILSIRDITQRMREFQSASFLPFAPYNSAAIFYIFLTLAAASIVNTVERKYHVKHR